MITNEDLSFILTDQLYKSVFELSIDGICILDANGNYKATNPAMSILTGYNSGELLCMSTIDFVPTEEKENSQLFTNKLLSEGRYINYQGSIKRKDGSILHIEINSTAIKNRAQKVIGSINIVRDITERKKIETVLIESKQHAEKSDKLKTAFLTNMSHEIRTPMNAILGFSELLKYRQLDMKDQEYYLDTIIKKGNHLLQLINDIIDISKIEAGDLQYQIEPINILNFFNECCTTLKDDFVLKTTNNVEFIYSMPSIPSNLEMLADPYRLNQVLINLFHNAKKFTRKGFIEFGATLSTNYEVVFYIKDSGIGIAREDQELVFERFRQTDIDSYKKMDGTGLGLAISRNIIQLLNGRIWLESEKGIGSCFYFAIPLNIN